MALLVLRGIPVPVLQLESKSTLQLGGGFVPIDDIPAKSSRVLSPDSIQLGRSLGRLNLRFESRFRSDDPAL
jgi:hypothetical protein